MPVALLLLVLLACPSGAATIDFDGLGDLEVVATQFLGLTFSNTITLTAGISLNEIDFPPRSGANVVSDDGGPITILFASPILSFSGYFTYLVPVSVQAFDASTALVDSATSLFGANDGFTGEPGSSPNELLQVAFADGISRLVITGDTFGGSFVMDDISYTNATPEPGTRTFVLLALAGVGIWRMSRMKLTA